MKKVLLLTTALALMNGNAWAEVIDSGKCGNNCTWTYDDETKTIKIEGTGKMDNATKRNECNDSCCYRTYAEWNKYENTAENVIIKGVENIGDNVFRGFTHVENVSIDNTVTKIGNAAFSWTNLQNVVIPDSVVSIDTWAFDQIHNLQELTIPDSDKSINSGAFSATPLRRVICSGEGDTAKCDAMLGGGVRSVSRPSYQKDENGKIVEKYGYDTEGNLVQIQKNDGSTYIYNKDGDLVGIKGKKIYTVEEAEAVTAHGDKFHVSLTYK